MFVIETVILHTKKNQSRLHKFSLEIWKLAYYA